MDAARWRNPDPGDVELLLRSVRTIAVVGASPRPERASHYVMEYLQAAGYRTLPVRPPGGEELLGERTFAGLRDVGPAVDLVCVFRAPEHVPALVDGAFAIGAPALWLQDGVVHDEAARRARAAGLMVVMDDCILRVHRRLLGARAEG